jgi:hypothetical protein
MEEKQIKKKYILFLIGIPCIKARIDTKGRPPVEFQPRKK